MCAAGTPASCSETALWRPGAALALEHNRDEMNNKPSSSSRFEGGNRPQRLGGTGTRHRNLHRKTGQFICLVNSVARVPACLAGSRGFDPRTGRQHQVSLAQWIQSTGLRNQGSHVRVVQEAPNSPRVAQWQSTVLIRRGPVDRSHPRGPTTHTRCGAAGSARASGARGRPFDPDHRDQSLTCAQAWP